MHIERGLSIAELLQICRAELTLAFKKTIESDDFNMPVSAIDAELIVMQALNIQSREDLLRRHCQMASDDEARLCYELLNRRLQGEPMAYIMGRKAFWEHDFVVSEKVLIPRPESELFIEVAMCYFKSCDRDLKILELGTGSGCIILSLLDIFKNSSGIATDISIDAINVAKINCGNLKLESRVTFVESDWFASVPRIKFDIILANPPYIAIDEFHKLSESVRCYEPENALTDYGSGLSHYIKIAQEASQFLKKEGVGMFECGYNQAAKVVKIIEQNNLKNLEVVKDLAGIKRLIVFSANV